MCVGFKTSAEVHWFNYSASVITSSILTQSRGVYSTSFFLSCGGGVWLRGSDHKIRLLKCHFSCCVQWLTGLYSGNHLQEQPWDEDTSIKGTFHFPEKIALTPGIRKPLECGDFPLRCVEFVVGVPHPDWMSGCLVTHEKLLFGLYLASTHRTGATWPEYLSHVQTAPRPPALLHPLVTGPAHVYSHAVYTDPQLYIHICFVVVVGLPRQYPLVNMHASSPLTQSSQHCTPQHPVMIFGSLCHVSTYVACLWQYPQNGCSLYTSAHL
jgi:hypothetical protein